MLYCVTPFVVIISIITFFSFDAFFLDSNSEKLLYAEDSYNPKDAKTQPVKEKAADTEDDILNEYSDAEIRQASEYDQAVAGEAEELLKRIYEGGKGE